MSVRDKIIRLEHAAQNAVEENAAEKCEDISGKESNLNRIENLTNIIKNLSSNIIIIKNLSSNISKNLSSDNQNYSKKQKRSLVEYNNDPIFERQERIEDWNQQALLNTRVAIIGSNIMASYLASCLSVLGIGSIYIIDNKKNYENEGEEDKKNFLLRLGQNAKRFESRAYTLERTIKQEIDPSRYVQIRSIVGNYRCLKLVPDIDIILDATNSPESKMACLKYADENSIPLVSLCCDEKNAYTQIYNPDIEFKEEKNESSLAKRLGISRFEKSKAVKEAAAEGSENALDNIVLKYFDKKKQHPLTAAISAGMAIDFVRKCTLKLKSDPEQKRIHSILYTFKSPRRLFYEEECREVLSSYLKNDIKNNRDNNEDENYANENHLNANHANEQSSKEENDEWKDIRPIDKKVLIAGAGAIGNFAALQLTLLGLKNIDIVDMDRIELTNANRQILICDRASKENQRKKAEVLSEKIKRINSEVNSRGIYGIIAEEASDALSGFLKFFLKEKKVDKQFIISNNYNAIIGCLDNPQARAVLNKWAVELKIPYIDSGTDAFNASIKSYIPGETGCLNCQMNIDRIAEDWVNKNRHRESCELNTKEPSVVTSNLIAGAIMAGEAYAILSNEKIFPAAKNNISYSSNHNPELTVVPVAEKPRENCKCNSAHD